MFRYTTYCTEEQTRRAVELGAPIKTFSQSFADEYRTSIIYDKYCSIPPIKREDCEDEIYADIPTAESMINWLESQGIKCFVLQDLYDDDSYNIQINNNLITTGHPQYDYPLSYNSRKEATLAAIDVALDYLMNNKKK